MCPVPNAKAKKSDLLDTGRCDKKGTNKNLSVGIHRSCDILITTNPEC